MQPNKEEVAAKVMDSEAILINLSNGIYYSMDKVGGLIWEIVEGRYSLEEMVGVIADRHEVSAEQVQADVKRIVEELVQENLVHEADGAVRSGESPSGNGGENGPYESPQGNGI